MIDMTMFGEDDGKILKLYSRKAIECSVLSEVSYGSWTIRILKTMRKMQTWLLKIQREV